MPEPSPTPELSDAERHRFDSLLQDAIDSLPPGIRALLDRVPVIVLDRPTPEMVRSLKREGTLEPEADGLDLCGLHSGVAITERSIEDPAGWGPWSTEGAGDGEAGHGGSGGPELIHLFRRGVIDLAGGWDGPGAEEEVYEEARITLLHEIGHHFGLDEDDLEELGYA
jgi:predicted Zn-dependent protease with MMP-like domain